MRLMIPFCSQLLTIPLFAGYANPEKIAHWAWYIRSITIHLFDDGVLFNGLVRVNATPTLKYKSE